MATVKVGTLVKIRRQSERFWVKVDQVDGDTLQGTVDNQLLNTEQHGLRFRDRVTFTKGEVIDILPLEENG